MAFRVQVTALRYACYLCSKGLSYFPLSKENPNSSRVHRTGIRRARRMVQRMEGLSREKVFSRKKIIIRGKLYSMYNSESVEKAKKYARERENGIIRRSPVIDYSTYAKLKDQRDIPANQCYTKRGSFTGSKKLIGILAIPPPDTRLEASSFSHKSLLSESRIRLCRKCAAAFLRTQRNAILRRMGLFLSGIFQCMLQATVVHTRLLHKFSPSCVIRSCASANRPSPPFQFTLCTLCLVDGEPLICYQLMANHSIACAHALIKCYKRVPTSLSVCDMRGYGV